MNKHTEEYKYYDKNGEQIFEGDIIEWDDGRRDVVYLTTEGFLGTDATNRKWIESGKAVACEYGIYPFNYYDREIMKKVK